MTGPDIGASIRARLLNKAKAEGQDFNLVLTRYALERLLYRLGSSSHAEHFLLKGALLFDLWFDIPHRPTRDVDLLGFGPAEHPDPGGRLPRPVRRRLRARRRHSLSGRDGPRPGDPQGGQLCRPPRHPGRAPRGRPLSGPGRCRLRRRGDAGPGAGRLPGHAARTAGPQTARLPALHRRRRKAGGPGHARHRQQPHEGLLRPVGPGPPGGLRRGYPDPGDPRDLRPARNPAAQTVYPSV